MKSHRVVKLLKLKLDLGATAKALEAFMKETWEVLQIRVYMLDLGLRFQMNH